MPAEKEIVIQSLFLQNDLITPKSDKIFFTAGLHPWHSDKISIEEISDRLGLLIQNKSIIAIGETGIDKIKGPDLDIQLQVLKAHIKIAEEAHLPVIIHSVKAHNEILKLKVDLQPKIPWVIHHFNGSRQMAFDFINHGFYLSLSHHISKNSRLSEYLKDLPIEKIFFETDDFDVDIKNLYNIAAENIGISIDSLKIQILKNLKKLLNE